jgi:hypothetical protein
MNAVFIGYMMGTYSVVGKGGAQAVANMAGEYVGREMVAYATSREIPIDSLPALVEFLQTFNLAGVVTIEEQSNQVIVQISQCGICPKRIGKYQVDGTACPWGGILIGALRVILAKKLSVSARLAPGEKCTITLQVKPSVQEP